MADQPTNKQVPMNTADVRQKKRMAAGETVTGQTTPSATQGADKQVTKPNA